jgi:P-type E1-E2 ATPase
LWQVCYLIISKLIFGFKALQFNVLLYYVDYRWVKISGTDLLPGDVVSIGRSSGQNGEEKSVPADMLILAGSAIVNEAILTGESTPQWKVFLFSELIA